MNVFGFLVFPALSFFVHVLSVSESLLYEIANAVSSHGRHRVFLITKPLELSARALAARDVERTNVALESLLFWSQVVECEDPSMRRSGSPSDVRDMHLRFFHSH